MNPQEGRKEGMGIVHEHVRGTKRNEKERKGTKKKKKKKEEKNRGLFIRNFQIYNEQN